MLMPSPVINLHRAHREVTDLQRVQRSTGDVVDAVVAWVDGADPKHRAKRKRYLALI
jgi:hypothetical protein